ncbi:18658_t:CDS:1, partial [Racocetra persica]
QFIYLLNELGISKNPKEALNLFEEVSKSNSKYKDSAREVTEQLKISNF